MFHSRQVDLVNIEHAQTMSIWAFGTYRICKQRTLRRAQSGLGTMIEMMGRLVCNSLLFIGLNNWSKVGLSHCMGDTVPLISLFKLWVQYFNPFMPNVFPILINWTSPFPILWVLGGIFHFYSNSKGHFCKQTVENLIRRRGVWSSFALFANVPQKGRQAYMG